MANIDRVYEKFVEQTPTINEAGLKVARTIHNAVLKGGEPSRKVADLLHGTWLGHPLHAVLTDITIGAWSLAAIFDILALVNDDESARTTADALTKAGVVSAVPTALAGVTDFSTVPQPAASTATMHGLINSVVLGMYLASLQERKHGRHKTGAMLSLSALGLAGISAWLGGHLVYSYRVGVDHSQSEGQPEDWMPVMNASELQDETPVCVDAQGTRVLLYRMNGSTHAIGAVCSHAAGPLEEGTFDGYYVQCPWHNSVFDLRDGDVRHGPAVHPQPRFETRIRDGQIEVRALRS